MKVDLLIIAARIALYVILGLEFSRAGIYVLSIQGAIVWTGLILLSLLSFYEGRRVYKQARDYGIRYAVAYMITHGWRKES